MSWIRENHEAFKNISAGVQSLVVALGIIVGGWWAVHKLSVLLEPERAIAQLDIEKREAEKRPLLKIRLQTRIEVPQDLCGPAIIATVDIENDGTESALLTFKNNPPIQIGKFSTESGPFAPLPSSPLWLVGARTAAEEVRVPRNASMTLQFFLPVPGPGTYLVQFKTPAPKPKTPEVRPYDLYAADYVIVKKPELPASCQKSHTSS